MVTQDVHTPPNGLTRFILLQHLCGYMHVSILYVSMYMYYMVFKAILIIYTTDSYGLVRMHVYMYLVFKE